ncbi:hypothetical protein LV89_02020 [Arcicella aurantiaca]|uniref:Uncharacterized protein n=1 Tax=Arcicella aurantiaca TaxID=591202 RepID=A0A316ECV8_9BACT|nr:hypothetical protein [Arcicella aurantiaca]PWK27205.1 hypothetical protein LV89_02020 [Arcicella aurantiaca]
MNFSNELQTAYSHVWNPEIPTFSPEAFLGKLEQQGFTIVPIPARQVHDIDRLIKAEQIIALQSKLLLMRADEIFVRQRELVELRNTAVREYYFEYKTNVELDGKI